MQLTKHCNLFGTEYCFKYYLRYFSTNGSVPFIKKSFLALFVQICFLRGGLKFVIQKCNFINDIFILFFTIFIKLSYAFFFLNVKKLTFLGGCSRCKATLSTHLMCNFSVMHCIVSLLAKC